MVPPPLLCRRTSYRALRLLLLLQLGIVALLQASREGAWSRILGIASSAVGVGAGESSAALAGWAASSSVGMAASLMGFSSREAEGGGGGAAAVAAVSAAQPATYGIAA